MPQAARYKGRREDCDFYNGAVTPNAARRADRLASRDAPECNRPTTPRRPAQHPSPPASTDRHAAVKESAKRAVAKPRKPLRPRTTRQPKPPPRLSPTTRKTT